MDLEIIIKKNCSIEIKFIMEMHNWQHEKGRIMLSYANFFTSKKLPSKFEANRKLRSGNFFRAVKKLGKI